MAVSRQDNATTIRRKAETKRRVRGLATHRIAVGQGGLELHVGVGVAQEAKGLAGHARVFGGRV